MHYSSYLAGVYRLNLFNNAEQKLYTKAIEVHASAVTENMQLPLLSRGVYTMKLANETIVLTNKVVVD